MSLLKKYQNISFYILTIIITTVIFLVSLWLQPKHFNLVQFGPAITAYVMAALSGIGVTAFSSEIFLKRIKIRWLLISIVIPLPIFWLGNSIEHLIQNQPLSIAPGPLAGVLFTFWGIAGNCLGSFAEEIGWRGFMQPRMAAKYGNLKSSIIIGIGWGVWHMGDYGEGLGFALFVVSCIGMSIIMTRLQEKGGGSVWMAGLFHIFFNFAAMYFLTGIPADAGRDLDATGMTLTSRAATAVACIIPAIVLVILSPVFKKQNKISARRANP